MFKKALVATAVLAATSGVAFANGGTMMVEPSHTCWYYIGVALSGDFGDFNVNTTSNVYTTATGPTAVTTFNNRSWDAAVTGVDGELYLGIGTGWQDHYYLGAEIFGDISSADGQHNETANVNPLAAATGVYTDSVTLEAKSNWGIAALLGYRYDRSLFYFRVGWESGHFEVTRGETNTLIPAGYLPANYSFSSTKSGLQLGLGVETMITDCWSIRAEYDWNRYNSFSGGATGAASATTTLVSNINIRPTVNKVKLGLTWRFNA